MKSKSYWFISFLLTFLSMNVFGQEFKIVDVKNILFLQQNDFHYTEPFQYLEINKTFGGVVKKKNGYGLKDMVQFFLSKAYQLFTK